MHDKVLLSSGGMDSFLLAHEPELAGAIHLYINAGQKYGHKERNAAKAIAASVGQELYDMQASDLARFEHPSGIIPFRNAEFILCAAQYADNIYLGVIADEVNSDKSIEFCVAMERVLNISHRRQYWTEGRQFQIRTPFRQDSKTVLAKRYLDRGGSPEDLLNTVSCYDAGDMHCGRCSSCFKRWVALTNAFNTDAANVQGWAQYPGSWYTREQWVAKLSAPEYSSRRLTEVLNALRIAGVA